MTKTDILFVTTMISSFSDYSLGVSLKAFGGGTPSSTSGFPSGTAIFFPIVLPRLFTVTSMFIVNGGTTAGNIDVGIYTMGGVRLVSSGPVLQSGTTLPQYTPISVELSPGRYYIAAALGNVTGTILRANIGKNRLQILGCASMSAAFPLPATAIYEPAITGLFPIFGIISKGSY